VCLAMPTLAWAQTSSGPQTPKFLIGPDGQYARPQRATAGLTLLIPTEKFTCEDGFCGSRAIEARTSVGAGGWRVAGGLAWIAYPLWPDLVATVTRTSATPRNASPRSTYVGVEAGYAFPVLCIRNQFISARPSLGVAQRVNGPSGPHRTMFNWGVSLLVVWPKF
jgi:hypothetical protein